MRRLDSRGLSALLVCAVWAVTACNASAQTVTNNGFETAPYPNGGGVGYGTPTNWSSTGSPGVNTTGGPFLNGLPIPEGTHVAFLQGGGSLSQTVTGFTVGKSYIIDYMFNERGSGSVSTAPYAQLDASTLLSQSGYQRHDTFERALTSSFTATSTSHTLTLGNSGGVGDNSLLLDAITVRRAAPMASNFDFDKVIIGANSFQYTPSGAGWTFAGGSGVSRNGSGFQNGPVNAAEGNQIGFMQQATSMSQTLSGFELGASYNLSFLYAGRTGGTGNNLLISMGANNIYTNGNVSSSSWSAGTSSTFIATQSSYTFTVAATNPLGGDRTTFVDDLRFFLVDENDAPTASAGGPYTYSAAGQTQTFNGSGTDAENMALTYAWTQAGNPIASGAAPSVGIASTGLTHPNSTSTVQLVTTDPGGASSGAASATVNYTNAAPTASAGGALSFNSSFANVTANGSSSDADLAVNASIGNFETNSVSWTSGVSPIGNTPNAAYNGSSTTHNAPNGITFSQAVAAGLTTTTSSVPLSLSVTDFSGSTASSSTTISYANSAPSAGAPTATVSPNYSVSFFDVFADLDLGGNSFASSFETLTFEFDLTQATLPSQVGDGFMVGGTTPTQTTSGTLSGTLSLSQLISLFGGLGTYTAWANVKDAAGVVSSQSFTVNVVPEPSSLLVWCGLVAMAAAAGWRKRKPQGS